MIFLMSFLRKQESRGGEAGSRFPIGVGNDT